MDSAMAHDLTSGEQRTSDVAAGEVKAFDQLKLGKDVNRALKLHNFYTPTKIQAAAIPMALTGMDLLVQSKSGTGKTLIYVLAALQLYDRNVTKPQALIIVPTRELAIQVEDTLNGIGEHLKGKFLAISCIGGTDVHIDRLRLLKARVVVGTPGRLLHLMQNHMLDSSAIRLLVLDEADQLYAPGSLQTAVDAIMEPLPPRRQLIACSATYEDALDERLAKRMHNPMLISNSERATVLLGIRQFVLELPPQLNNIQEMRAKLAALGKILQQLPYEQVILFASSQMRADSYCNYLRAGGLDCELMSGALKQSERLEAFLGYRRFTVRTMIATDLMARGVDSAHANLVVNLDLPKDHVTYLHRIGRAGRFGSKGIAVTLLASQPQRDQFRRLIAEAGTGMSVMQFPTELPENFDFWDYDAYEFPYFAKAEAQEEEETALPQSALEQGQSKEPEQGQSIEIAAIAKAGHEEEMTVEAIKANEANKVSPIRPELAKQSNVLDEPEILPKPTEENKENDSVSQLLLPQSSRAKAALKTQNKADQKRQETPLIKQVEAEAVELELTAEAALDTKTYCLALPTERSSTTLQPLGVSNTVDDASSIVSDSVENGYNSDGSYASFYSRSDERLIWRRCQRQLKWQLIGQTLLGKRKKRSVCIYDWLSKGLKRRRHRFKRISVEQQLDEPEEQPDYRQLKEAGEQRKLFLKSRKIEPIAAPLAGRQYLPLLRKFSNYKEIRQSLSSLAQRRLWSSAEMNNLLEQLNATMQQLYYEDHSKPKQKQSAGIRRTVADYEPEQPLESRHFNSPAEGNSLRRGVATLRVCVNKQLNIPPVEAAPNAEIENRDDVDAEAEAVESAVESEASGPADSENEHESESSSFLDSSDALEPAYSSGFVESNDSVSSGIDTSQYSTNSTAALDLDPYDALNPFSDTDEDDEEEEDGSESFSDVEEQTDVSIAGTSSRGSEMLQQSDSEDSDESVSEQEEEEEPAQPPVYPLSLHQARWEQLFNAQRQCIEDYVALCAGHQ